MAQLTLHLAFHTAAAQRCRPARNQSVLHELKFHLYVLHIGGCPDHDGTHEQKGPSALYSCSHSSMGLEAPAEHHGEKVAMPAEHHGEKDAITVMKAAHMVCPVTMIYDLMSQWFCSGQCTVCKKTSG